MTTLTPAPPTAAPTPEKRAARLSRWSWLMLLGFAVSSIVVGVLGTWFMHLLDLREGDLLLMAGGAGAWAAELVVILLWTAPAVAGVVLATVALQRGARRHTWVALAVNALLVVWVLFVFVDDIRMTYFAGG